MLFHQDKNHHYNFSGLFVHQSLGGSMRTVSLCEEREEDIAAILKQPDSSLLLLSNVHFASMDWLAQLPNRLRDTTAKGIACFCLFD